MLLREKRKQNSCDMGGGAVENKNANRLRNSPGEEKTVEPCSPCSEGKSVHAGFGFDKLSTVSKE